MRVVRVVAGTAGRRARGDRAIATRALILDTAEELFVRDGLHGVSNRQIAAAAGQGNNTVVGYHFGSKADLVTAIVRRHVADVDRRRDEAVAALPPRPSLAGWVACLVRPAVDHLAALPQPSRYGRFTQQVLADPALRAALSAEVLGSESLRAVLDGIATAAPAATESVRYERYALLRILVVHGTAECEQRVADGAAAAAAWAVTGDVLTAAVVAVCGVSPQYTNIDQSIT